MKDWKVKFYLEECDNMFTRESTEVDMPYIPRIGEKVWIPERCEKELNSFAAKCWENIKCNDCPYMYGKKESVAEISTADFIWVHDILYDVTRKEVYISLSNRPKEDGE